MFKLNNKKTCPEDIQLSRSAVSSGPNCSAEAPSRRVIIAISGGVDSSVAAALLKKQGFDVVGVHMKFWSPTGSMKDNRCCTPESEKMARLVAKKLGIPFYVFNFKKEFKKRIVDYFLKTEKQGRTPNPCVVCNKEIKFGLLLEKAFKLGADYVATGHYARLQNTNKYKYTKTKNLYIRKKFVISRLFRGKDKEKDQSYFLWKLNQKQLKHVLFPVGDYTKPQVRALARKFKLPVAETPESQEVCFIQTTINDFLRKYIKNKPGKIIDGQGNILGEHQGLWFYTIGQRKGINISGCQTPVSSRVSDTRGAPDIIIGKAFYVLDKDIKNNTLIVTQNEKDLLKKELVAKGVNWVSGESPKLPLKAQVKIRYRSPSVPAVITQHLTPNTYHLEFTKPQRAITPGQSAVFYAPARLVRRSPKGEGGSSQAKEGKNEELLGGGIIV